MLTLAKPLQSAKGEMRVCKSDTWLTKLVLARTQKCIFQEGLHVSICLQHTQNLDGIQCHLCSCLSCVQNNGSAILKMN